ncbi:hypothetical protein [Ramlibacter sp.]|uniref:hypothetical protein n=1 Tax=Ramlibacter sp. TaxID=1917967 RepID=UPI002CEE1B8A|nr:hypothetical protein [Ramlibacter sp.]HWI82867.1 hypothetical protein [Ramlibacter sp.]
MRLLLQSAMIFFGTLMAAALLALGEPQPAPQQPSAGERQVLVVHRSWHEPSAPAHAAR